ncbi:hypothetical protein VSX64_14455 [Aurantimonas sp. C2-6-R+9]|uniref:DUF4376 domain-containing protein n=1 Tax=unclassified Aurantimonas TaxID=2638230 RepID=UPI002E16D808|nr:MULTISPECIES: hypothetical protein [unclassified Aurantimonas]MEC5291957.1 hypothetical protein [Aurantimonas sp. C2-3-R2]MEC5382069.1 hypothetical protein [Aurantimonas sp. C2-6-R+9]MEC5413043.1 hypothetical protein [Aurantimonas sp. C2-4-R8]
MWYYGADGDIIISVASAPIGPAAISHPAYIVPEQFALWRVVDGALVAAADHGGDYHVDPADPVLTKHVVAAEGRQAVACAFDDLLVVDAGTVRPESDADRLDRARAAKAVAVNAQRDAIIGVGYQHNFGATAGIRTLDQRSEGDAINWLGLKNLADAAIAAGAGADPMEIRDAADETFSASATVVSSALVAMAQWRGAVMSRSWALKDAIAAAADEAALDAIDIEAGWPT